MKILRAKLPAGSALRALQNSEAYGDKLCTYVIQLLLLLNPCSLVILLHVVLILTGLLELESQFGTLPLYTPVIDEILAFMPTVRSNFNNDTCT